jgi:hypothetical protein
MSEMPRPFWEHVKDTDDVKAALQKGSKVVS